MYKELRIDKQILEELFGAKFLCGSYDVKFINCCRDITPEQWKTSQKWHKCGKINQKNIYTHD